MAQVINTKFILVELDEIGLKLTFSLWFFDLDLKLYLKIHSLFFLQKSSKIQNNLVV